MISYQFITPICFVYFSFYIFFSVYLKYYWVNKPRNLSFNDPEDDDNLEKFSHQQYENKQKKNNKSTMDVHRANKLAKNINNLNIFFVCFWRQFILVIESLVGMMVISRECQVLKRTKQTIKHCQKIYTKL